MFYATDFVRPCSFLFWCCGRLDLLEWVELLEQTECLDYVSPDVEACIERQCRMEGNQELELTGAEFIDSPAIPKLPSLNTLSAERSTILKPIAQPQRTHIKAYTSMYQLLSNVILSLSF